MNGISGGSTPGGRGSLFGGFGTIGGCGGNGGWTVLVGDGGRGGFTASLHFDTSLEFVSVEFNDRCI